MLTVHYNTALPVLHFSSLQAEAGLVHVVSTRRASVSGDELLDFAWQPGCEGDRARRSLASVAAALDIDPGGVCCALQVHGSRVLCVDALPPAVPGYPWRICGEADALVTERPGITLCIRVADCVPILLYDPVRRVVGVVHAGWKGTLAAIAAATVARMCARYGCRPADLRAGIGPSIGACCFTVGEDVAESFRRRFVYAGRCMLMSCCGTTIDLPEANRVQLLGSGLLPDSIELSGYCTACRTDMFFSHRSEAAAGRFALCAGLRG